MRETEEITEEQIKEYLGHGLGFEGNCRVRIVGSIVERFGRPDSFDRMQNYWHFLGSVEDVKDEIREYRRGNHD